LISLTRGNLIYAEDDVSAKPEPCFKAGRAKVRLGIETTDAQLLKEFKKEFPDFIQEL